MLAADKGKENDPVLQTNTITGGLRLSFQLALDGNSATELRAQIFRNDAPLSEAWVYRWTQ